MRLSRSMSNGKRRACLAASFSERVDPRALQRVAVKLSSYRRFPWGKMTDHDSMGLRAERRPPLASASGHFRGDPVGIEHLPAQSSACGAALFPVLYDLTPGAAQDDIAECIPCLPRTTSWRPSA